MKRSRRLVIICTLAFFALMATTIMTTSVKSDSPTNLIVEGNTTGDADTNYTYTATADDPDGDDICYTFIWGDGTNDTTTDYVANATSANATHQWTSAGIYTIEVFAMDYPYNATSGLEYLTILIDVLYVKDIGYLLDNDGNGVYGEFYSNETENKTTTEYDSENGTYLINSDGVEGWDYIYDSVTDTLTECEGEEEITPLEEDSLVWYMLALGVIISIIALLAISHVTKRK